MLNIVYLYLERLVIISQPVDQRVVEDGECQFDVQVKGDQGSTVQWFHFSFSFYENKINKHSYKKQR